MERATFDQPMAPHHRDWLDGKITALQSLAIGLWMDVDYHRRQARDCAASAPGMSEYHRKKARCAYLKLRAVRGK